MKGPSESPAIRQIDPNHLSRTNPGCDQPTRRALHQVPVFCIGESPRRRTRGVHNRELVAMFSAGIEHHVVDELVFGIVKQSSAKWSATFGHSGPRESLTGCRS